MESMVSVMLIMAVVKFRYPISQFSKLKYISLFVPVVQLNVKISEEELEFPNLHEKGNLIVVVVTTLL